MKMGNWYVRPDLDRTLSLSDKSSSVGTGTRSGVQLISVAQPPDDDLVTTVKPPRTAAAAAAAAARNRGAVTVRAMYNYESTDRDDLSFHKGDVMIVEEQSGDWMVATHTRTGQRGVVPCNYVRADSGPQAQDWWFDATRQEAETLLLRVGLPTGTFLVRESQDRACSVLSVRHVEGGAARFYHYRIMKLDDRACSVLSVRHVEGGAARVYHYRIMKLDGQFCLTTTHRFPSLAHIIQYYKANAGFLCVPLSEPCPRRSPEIHFPKELRVPRAAVTFMDKLGSGHFGEVFKGTLTLGGVRDVAIKTLRAGSSMTPDSFLGEARLMHRLRHQRLVQLLAVCADAGGPLCIVTELMAKGSLRDYLRQDQGVTVKLKDVVYMAWQISEAMEYLEQENFVHRDLRAANILVGEHHDVKVADFGLASIVTQHRFTSDTADTRFAIKWTAPEAVLGNEFSIKSDVWSFGVLLYELFTLGGEPYPGMSTTEVLVKLKQGYRMPRPEGGAGCTAPLNLTMASCWRDRPQERPSFASLHAFFGRYHDEDCVALEEERYSQ